ncbi:hypothetical protein L1887_33907 [Cichorium endivia]|nr:hypothetical protein L1887_33907 [Cichorium endivia]
MQFSDNKRKEKISFGVKPTLLVSFSKSCPPPKSSHERPARRRTEVTEGERKRTRFTGARFVSLSSPDCPFRL